jgi:hypothetical protein
MTATMTTIDPASFADVRVVANRMRQADIEEFSAVNHVDGEDLAELMIERYGDRGDVLCAKHPMLGPIAIGATIEGRPNVITLMFFATADFPLVALALTRFITKQLFPRYKEAGIHRIECMSIEGHTAAQRWIEILGLKREATIRGFGKNGETYHQYAWVSDDVG